ncbi:hypothetical protein [Thermoanaerobacterium aotearoense]|uniref:hypothetical protein n=1 Tax=Thermoanaerobacterium aotearoense TaxID=47490 RepID=UPI001F1960EB|nr:hypothetical protein [Thermoanaerobacterium aotearoense]
MYYEANRAKDKFKYSSEEIKEVAKNMYEISAFFYESRGHEKRVFIKNAQGLADLHNWLIHRWDDAGEGNIHFQRRFQYSPFESVDIKDEIYIKFNENYFLIDVDNFAGKFIGKGGKNIKALSRFIGKRIIILK